MDPLYVVIFISFFCGAMGYIILQFWIRPIWRYRKIKSHITSDIKGYTESRNFKHRSSENSSTKRLETMRRHSTELADCFNFEIPPWYKLLLTRRREFPLDASRHLLALANIHDHNHARTRLDKIKKSLNLNI